MSMDFGRERPQWQQCWGALMHDLSTPFEGVWDEKVQVVMISVLCCLLVCAEHIALPSRCRSADLTWKYLWFCGFHLGWVQYQLLLSRGAGRPMPKDPGCQHLNRMVEGIVKILPCDPTLPFPQWPCSSSEKQIAVSTQANLPLKSSGALSEQEL